MFKKMSLSLLLVKMHIMLIKIVFKNKTINNFNEENSKKTRTFCSARDNSLSIMKQVKKITLISNTEYGH